MENKHTTSVGIGGDEDEIDCFSQNFDPSKTHLSNTFNNNYRYE